MYTSRCIEMPCWQTIDIRKYMSTLELHPSRRWISTGCDLIDVNFVQVREIWEKPFTKKELKEVEWLDPQKDKESTHE